MDNNKSENKKGNQEKFLKLLTDKKLTAEAKSEIDSYLRQVDNMTANEMNEVILFE